MISRDGAEQRARDEENSLSRGTVKKLRSSLLWREQALYLVPDRYEIKAGVFVCAWLKIWCLLKVYYKMRESAVCAKLDGYEMCVYFLFFY